MQVSSFDGGDIQIKMSKAILDAIIDGMRNMLQMTKIQSFQEF